MSENEKQEVRTAAGITYLCGFCEAEFGKASECAKHIEEKSVLGIAYPTDIIISTKN